MANSKYSRIHFAYKGEIDMHSNNISYTKDFSIQGNLNQDELCVKENYLLNGLYISRLKLYNFYIII